MSHEQTIERLYDVRIRDLDQPGVQFDISDVWAENEPDACQQARRYARHITTSTHLAVDVIRTHPVTTVQESI
jgi:hypothetical protein